MATNKATVAGDFHFELEAGCRHNILQEATTSNKSFLGSGGNRINPSGQAPSCWGVIMTLSPPRQCGAVQEPGAGDFFAKPARRKQWHFISVCEYSCRQKIRTVLWLLEPSGTGADAGGGGGRGSRHLKKTPRVPSSASPPPHKRPSSPHPPQMERPRFVFSACVFSLKP